LDDTESYERLEFLGDAVLELTVSEELYRRLPDFQEGRLTKTRSSLVRGETLAKVARSLDLGSMLLVGKGVDTTGGRQQESVLAAAFEAVVAAVYLDQGLDRAREFVLGVMATHFAEAAREGPPPENPKSLLQEHLQSQGIQTPKYRLAGSEGPDHGPVFTVEVLVDDEVIGIGRGGKKSEAEVQAARAALEQLLSSLS
jgi:ribonuclease-3